ncbi:quaternary ammonium compound-resistance protein SugE [Cryobacterium flavum]|uniref:Quaternary ammonium compound-resistance protein SugE n=1 Tax=Cryobacterium flavum TaxID=1424659 RepID=A0A5E9FZK1_9MICO|nr:quaternary ammonium compound-resistance protein SugE [Cryobacterium flavum]
MSWIVLIASGVLEAVWTTALGRSVGFTKLWPTVIFGAGLALSMGGLAGAMREILIGEAMPSGLASAHL